MAPVQEGSKVKLEKVVCWSLEVQPTGVGQAGPGDGSNQEVGLLRVGGHRAKASGPGAGLGRISLTQELFLLCQVKELGEHP